MLTIHYYQFILKKYSKLRKGGHQNEKHHYRKQRCFTIE